MSWLAEYRDVRSVRQLAQWVYSRFEGLWGQDVASTPKEHTKGMYEHY